MVIGAIVVLALFLPALMPGSGIAADMGVTLYDKDGNVVGSYAFVSTGGKVTSLTVTLSYAVTSSSERFEEYLGVAGDVVIRWIVAYPSGSYQTAATHTILEARTATCSYSWDHLLTDIITVTDLGKQHGWNIQITATLIAETVMEGGETVTSDPWTEDCNIQLAWQEETLVITGMVGG